MRLSASRLAVASQSRGLGDRLWDLAGMPSLSLQFATTRSLIDVVSGQNLITFSRLSDGTTINSAGQIEIVPAGVPRFTHDPVTLASLGLLVEEQKANLLLNSATLSTQTVTVTAAAHTLSFYGTGTVTLSGVSTAGPLVGTGANARVSLSFTPTAGSLTLTVSGSVTSAQLETGGLSSYIPTAVSSVVRAADVPLITGANFSSWYRQDEGIIFVDYRFLNTPNTTGARVFQISNASGSDLIWLRAQAGVNRFYDITVGGASQAAFNQGAYSAGTAYRAALAMRANDFAFSENGGAVLTDSSGTMPTVDRMGIGCEPTSNGSQGNVAIARLDFYPRRLPNSILQELSR